MKPPGEGKQSPEYQLTKLREQARSGGGGGGARRPRSGASDVSLTPQAEETPRPPSEGGDEVVLDLMPDANDKDMEELLGILNSKGFDAVMKELDRMNNPHLEDDFHRLLVQYRREGHPIPGLNPDDPLAKALDFILLEVSIPVIGKDKGGNLREVMQSMEQFYLSVTPFVYHPDPIFFKDLAKRKVNHKDHFTMELAVTEGGEEAIFYIAAHRARRENVERQLLSVFPNARINEEKNDNNIFNQFGEVAFSYGTLFRPPPYPLKTEGYDYDPMNLLLAALSKVSKEGEGAAVQISVAGAGEYHLKRFREVLKDFKKGKVGGSKIFQNHKYLKRYPFWRRLFPMFKTEFENFLKSAEQKKKESEKSDVDGDTVAQIQKKMKSVIFGVNIRLVTSARTKERAEALLRDLEASFGQFEDPVGNVFKFRRPKTKEAEREFIRSFIFRTFDRDSDESLFNQIKYELFDKMPVQMSYGSPVNLLNSQELSAVFHLAIAGSTSSREAKTTGATLAPAPVGLPQEGILIGRNRYANTVTDIYLTPEDRLRHFYTIGQTGTGKTNFLKQMIIQDIENGEGVCFIDPHGVDVLEILSRIPKERIDDLIYFDPAHTERPMGLNMLEYDPRFPEQKTFVVDEMFKIFKKLYGDVPEAFGPIFEQYFRNATLLVVEDPETGSTLLDISRVLSDEDFRALKLSRSRNQVVNHFWEDIAEQVRGEGDIRNVVPYITSKFDIFLANEVMRPIIGQQQSSFNFKDIMDNRKILLVNLSKGRLGDLNANLLGLVLVGKILMTALARASYLSPSTPPFYLYMDEFQNITTDTVSTILSEARKYKLSLTVAHQFIKQLQPSISDAVFGNVGSMATFRVGPDDAAFLEKIYQPKFGAGDMVNIDNYNAYIKMLADGKPMPAFSMETLPFRSGDFAQIDALKQLSYQRFGRPRAAIEAEINEKYRGMRGM